jgi:signal transduction histidine kinase
MKTHFAPAERATAEQLHTDSTHFSNFKYVSEIINALPYIAAILNKERQVVFANKALLQLLGINDLDECLGQRPGELLNCIHARETEGGCGTTESCRYCGAVNAIQDCLETGERITNECRITAMVDQKEIAYDLSVTASPFRYRKNDFVVLSFNDIGNEKRRQMLERVFFHDIINTAGGLRGFIEFLRITDDPEERQQYLAIADELSNTLIDEINSQRELLSAESGNLRIHVKQIIPAGLLHEVVNQLAHHHVAADKTIEIDPQASAKKMHTDPVLLKRVLVNLLKNALEASPKGETIRLGCHDLDEEKIFWVHNNSFMSKEVQMQIFQRSFSTKGTGRGIGTYSIKLFTEQYLQGKITFVSDMDKGTIFRVYLPENIE